MSVDASGRRAREGGRLLLLPGDPLRPRGFDPCFAPLVEPARQVGLTPVRVDHDAWVAGDVRSALARVPDGPCTAVYRGWMVPAARYEALVDAAATRGVAMLTDADDYRRSHELPGWIVLFEELTPHTVLLPWTWGVPVVPSRLTAVPTEWGAAVVKDWVKSRKHEWDTACFVPDTADRARLAAVVSAFLDGQGADLTGGVAVRRWEDWRGAEARVWWVAGKPVMVSAHPDTPGQVPRLDPQTVSRVAAAVHELDAPFVTTDLARRADGQWRVVEVGDGQVSGLPEGCDPAPVLSALARVLLTVPQCEASRGADGR